jgi:leucyl aminopeptidase
MARSGRVNHLAISAPTTATEVIETAIVGAYRYETYKAESDRTPDVEHLTIVGDAIDTATAASRANAQNWARDLVNMPPADMNPSTLANQARLLSQIPGVEVEVWETAKLHQQGCVGILAVGQGSSVSPCMIRIRYRPENATSHICLVGKGVTFDAGGLSIKPSSGMLTMRCDMGGAANALAITRAVAEIGLPVALDTFVGAAENMLSGNSYKLGDILTYNNGVAVEVHNTDAEGRLVLADCLIEASNVDGATHILDFATLTGACVVAVGSDFTGLFTADDDLASELLSAADDTGEGLWRLPLHPGYREMIKAEWGTIKNVGGREAGASTAALFLENFVEGKRWAHLDIAGPAFLNKASGAYVSGATGQMVRAVTTWISRL